MMNHQTFCRSYPLANCPITNWKTTMLLMGKSTISMAIFHSKNVCLPEGIPGQTWRMPGIIRFTRLPAALAASELPVAQRKHIGVGGSATWKVMLGINWSFGVSFESLKNPPNSWKKIGLCSIFVGFMEVWKLREAVESCSFQSFNHRPIRSVIQQNWEEG